MCATYSVCSVCGNVLLMPREAVSPLNTAEHTAEKFAIRSANQLLKNIVVKGIHSLLLS